MILIAYTVPTLLIGFVMTLCYYFFVAVVMVYFIYLFNENYHPMDVKKIKMKNESKKVYKYSSFILTCLLALIWQMIHTPYYYEAC